MKQLNWYQIFGKSNIPDGRTVLPTDDIQTWLNCANIWDKTYTTLAEVLVDTDTLSVLIASENAVDYMVRSTSWAIASVPNMTSATTPSGKVTASSQPNSNRPAWKAYNGVWAVGNDGWENYNGSSNHSDWIDYEFTAPVVVNKLGYFITSNRSCTYRIQGSNDGITYTDIKVFSNVTLVSATTTFVTFENNTAYAHYRIYFDNMPYYNSSLYYLVGSFNLYCSCIVSDSTAMSYIGLNNYCANTLLADSTWCEAICNSEYFESVLNVKVPTMTSNTTPSGECFADVVGTSNGVPFYYPWKAFSGQIDAVYCWIADHGSYPHYLGYKFLNNVKTYKVVFGGRYNTSGTRSPKNFTVQGSTDSATWTDVASFTHSNTNDVESFVCHSVSAYNYIRIYVTTGYDTNYVAISQCQFYGREDV